MNSLHQFAVRLSDLQLRCAGLYDSLQHDLAHHLGGLGHPLSERARHGDHLLAGETRVDEYPRTHCGLGVGTQMNRRIRIVDAWETECPLEWLKHFEVDAGVLADLPRRHIDAVVPDEAACRHQHRREL